MLIADFFFQYRGRFQTSQLATIGVLAAMIPVVTLAVDGGTRRMFGGAFVVDPYSLVLQGFFLAAAYVSMLLSVDYIGDGDYYQGEFDVLLLDVAARHDGHGAARDLITIFVALETISIPTFVLAGWRKHDPKSNEAAIKYYLIGVLSSAVMLYGMSLVFGLTGSTLPRDIVGAAPDPARRQLLIVAVVPHARRVRVQDQRGAVPLLGPGHLRGRAHPGHRVPLGRLEGGRLRRDAVDRHLRVLPQRRHVAAGAVGPRGRVDDPRQPGRAAPDEHRPDAGVLVDREGGFILVPFAVAADGEAAWSIEAVVYYLLIYGAMNLGAFAIVIVFSRVPASGDLAYGAWARTCRASRS